MHKHDVMTHVKQVEVWCLAARDAAAYYLEQCTNQNVSLSEGLSTTDLRKCSSELERTHLLRLFSEFVRGLRACWIQGMGRKTNPVVEVLMDRIATRHFIPTAALGNAHQVRQYRNVLVHGGSAPSVTLGDSRKYLCTYLSYLPLEW